MGALTFSIFLLILGTFLLTYICLGMTWQGVDIVRHEIRKRRSR